MAIITIQAPCGSLVMTMTTDTTAVAVAPTPFITARQRQPLSTSFRRNQWTTMPACEMVKLVNTPTA